MQYREDETNYGDCLFEQFVHANTFRTILNTFKELCDFLQIQPDDFKSCYPFLKNRLTSWKAKTLWNKLDKRASHKEYKRGKACANTKVFVIGCGPCGLRTAIEASLLGAKVVVVEKRDRFSRNNVLHLWPYVIEDLKSLAAKKFYGKFCAGSIEHISIRQLQCILLKVSLLYGVEVHGNVTFEGLLEPPEEQEEQRIGWKALVSPSSHPVADYEFDVLIGADGKRNTLGGFKRKEFRGKLAIAITANFINRFTLAEQRVEEISGVAYIFNQKFFQDLKAQTLIDLENIVYYKDETHYFVMTAKKQSLLEKGVLLEDYTDTESLLSPENISQEALLQYAREAADFSSNHKLPRLDFALNHYGLPDVAMFDFTSMFAAETAARVVERNGCQLLVALVGDSLLEPFWPTGSGCARGFLGVFDTAWMIKSWASGRKTPLEVLAERESIYRLLAQTTPENLHKNFHQYTIDPRSRYPNLNMKAVDPESVLSLYDDGTDVRLESLKLEKVKTKVQRKGSVVRSSKLLLWCQKAVENYPGIQVDNITSSWKNGLLLCAIIQRFRPDLINYECLKAEEVAENNQLAFDIAEREFGITPVMTGKEMASLSQPDKLTMVAYLSQFYEIFKDELPLETVKQVDLPEEEFIPGRKAQRLSLLTRLNKKLSQKKSPRREKDYGNREEKENQRKSPAGGSRRREIARRYHEDLLNAENEAKLWDKREDLNVGVRGANKVSAMANSLFAQFQEIAGVKQTPSKAVNRPSFVVGSSHSSPINTMAEQLYEQFEVLAGQKHQSQLEGKRSMTSKNKQIQDMAEQLRAHFQKADSSQMEPRYGDQVQEMVTLLQDQFNRLAGCESADIEPIDKPQISVSTHYHIKDMAVKLENNFKDITSMSPKPVAGEQRPQVSPQQQGKIKELAEELHNKFAAMTAVQHPELVLDRRRSLNHIKAMSDTLLTQFKEKQRQQHTCSEPTGHINRMAEHLLEQCQQIAIEKEAAQQVTPSKKSVSVKAQQLQAKFKELSGEKPTIKEPPKRATHGAKKPVDTGALSHRQVHDMAGQILNKFEQISNPSIEKSKSASSASSTEVQFMTYQLLAKVEEMAKQTAEPKKITQISEGQLQETTDRFLSDMQERQKQPEKTNVTTGVGSIYDILMARFQPVEEDNTSKDDNQDEPLTELNIADRMLFSKFRDIAGLKSTRAEDQQKEPKQRTSWWGSQQPKSKQFTGSSAGGSDICFFCCKRVYVMERLSAEGLFFHRGCFKCSYCNTTLRIGNYAFYMPPNENKLEGRFYCRPHFKYSKAADGGPRKRRMMELGAKENLPDSPPVLVTTTPDKQSWLAELDGPLEKKSRGTPDHLNRSWESLSNCTPERIFLDSTLDGTLQRSQMSEEEISNYNYGDAASVHEMTEYDESSSSDDSDVEFDIEPVAVPAEHSDHWQKSPQWDLSDDDDYSWDESDNDYEEDDYDYESDDDLSDGEMVPVEVDSRNLAWTEPESPKENVMAENEVNNIVSDAEGEKTPEAADSSNEELQPLSESLTKQEFPEIQQTELQPEPQNKDSPEELFDHQGFVASMTSLKLQWLSNPEPPDHSMWGRRRLPSKTPKTVSLEEEKPPPIPPLPSQEDLVKAHIIKAEDMTAEKVKPDIDDEDTSVETVEEVVLVDKVTEEEEIIKEQLPKGDLVSVIEVEEKEAATLMMNDDELKVQDLEEGEILMDEIEENELGEVPVNTCHIVEEYEDDFEEDVDEDHKFDETGSLDAFEDEIETLEWNSATDKTGILDVPIVEDKVSHDLHQETLLKESKTNLGDVVEQEAVVNADDDKDDNDLINDIDDVVKHKAVDNADDDNDLINDIDDVVKHKAVDNDLINNVVEQEVIVDNGNALIDVTNGVVAINSDNTKKDSLDEKQDTVHVEKLNGIDEIEKSSDSDEANIAEIYGATLAYIDDQSESVSEKDDLTSNDTMDAVDREKDFEELACFTPREDKPNGNVVNHDTEHVESYEQNLADVYGETLARIETTESPVDEKKIEDIFRYQQSIGDSAEILTADEKQDLAVGEKSQLMDEDIKDDTIKAEIQSLKSMCENTEDKEAVIDDSFTSFVVIDDDVAGNQERFAVSDEEVEMGVECLENKSYVNTPECTPELNIDARNITVRKVRTLESVSSDFAIISCSDPSLVSHDIPPICDFEKESEVEESFCNISLAGQTTDSAPGEIATFQDLDVSFNSTCEDSSNIYATPDSSLNYGDTFFESLDKTDRTSTMSTEHSSRPESVISLENIDCINEDLNISIMSTDSDSNDSIRETLEMYAKELEYQSTRDAGGDEDTLPRTPGDESKLFPTVELKDQRNNVQSRDEMETKTKNEMETKTKNEMEIRTKDEMETKTKNEMEIRTKDEMKIGTKDEMPILEVKEKETQKTKKKHQKKKMHVDSFDDIFVKENRSAEVVNKKSDKARTEKKVKGKAKKYVASDVNDESSAAKCDTLSAKGDTVYKGTAKAKVEEKRKESESALKYRPLPVAPSALKGAVKSDEGGVTKSKTPKHEIRKEKKTFDQLPSKKGSRDSSPVVTVSPGDKEVEFNKSPKKAGKKLSSTGKACGSADGKSPKSPKERKGNTLKKLKDEIKKIDLDGKSKSPSKSKPDTSLVKESSKSKMNNKKKNENTREKSPEKKVLAPLAKLDMSDDLLSDDCVLMDQPSVKPKVQTSGSYKPRPLPPRPDTKGDGSGSIVSTGDQGASSTSSDIEDLSGMVPPLSTEKKKSKKKSFTKKLKGKPQLSDSEVNAKLTKRVQKAVKKQHRQEELKRLRLAQEIQRQLQEVEVKQKQLEVRGVEVEKTLRGESDEVSSSPDEVPSSPVGEKDETVLMQEWFTLVNEKNALVRVEQELSIRAKELELEDRHSRLQQELRDKMSTQDSKKSKKELDEEKKLLAEMLEVVEQRDALVALLEEERLKEKDQDKSIETVMLKKGFNITSEKKQSIEEQ